MAGERRYERRLLGLNLVLLALLAGFLLWTFWNQVPKPWRDLNPAAVERAVTARGDLADIEETTTEIFRQVSPSVVHITTLVTASGPFSLNAQQVPEGTGSGFVWDQDGHIVTNFHVIRDASAAVILFADLRDFTALSEATEPKAMIAALDTWFDRVAGAVHAFGGEVLKFIGDGVLAIFPVTGAPAEACEAALRAIVAARAGMAHLDAVRQAQGLPPLPFGAALHLGEILWGNIGAADRLDFTAIGPAVNLVSRLEGLCRPLGRSVLISGAVAAETTAPLVPLGEHVLRGIAAPCAVFTLSDA